MLGSDLPLIADLLILRGMVLSPTEN